MLWRKLKKILKLSESKNNTDQQDVATIDIDVLTVSMSRTNAGTVPHEFSVFVPRVEMNIKYYQNDSLWCEKNLIFNSLTIVHAPRHAPADQNRLPLNHKTD